MPPSFFAGSGTFIFFVDPDKLSAQGRVLAGERSLLMSLLLTKVRSRAFRWRWQRVNAREAEELRATGVQVKWLQFNTLLAWAQQLGWAAALGEEEAQVRQRWAQLRKARGG
jgi:hypothetical protein